MDRDLRALKASGRSTPKSSTDRGQRHSAQREAILASVRDVPNFQSAQAIYRQLVQENHPVGLATVYRQLQSLVEEGCLDALPSPDGTIIYRECVTARHHHHLICKMCGKAIEVELEGLEGWASEVAERAGFAQVSHTLEVFGVCPSCQTPQ